MDFWKLHGAGNDFILIDNRTHMISDLPGLAKSACHRRFGVGSDGLMAVDASEIADVRMLYYNSDGSPASMCGNGIRCFAKFVHDSGILNSGSFTVETGDGIKEVFILSQNSSDSVVRVAMGKASQIKKVGLSVQGKTFESIFMHFGVPHTMLFSESFLTDSKEAAGAKSAIAAAAGSGCSVSTEGEAVFPDELIKSTDLYGPVIEKHPSFPEGSNVNFVRVVDDSRLLVSTWERGAGRTLACGTGACASAAAAHSLDLVGPAVRVGMPGGEVTVRIAGDGALTMEGHARLICKGTLC